MNQLTILQVPKLVFGEHAVDRFVDHVLLNGYKKLFLLSIDPVLALLSHVIEALQKDGVEIITDLSIVGEPSFADFERILEEARMIRPDVVAGIGGGSVLDVAKLVAAQIDNTQTTNEIKGIGNLKQRNTHLICIPTTSGTGSEVSPNALFVDESGNKIGVISPFLVPDAAFIDPALTVSVPASVTAATGIDALAHCLEAYTNKFAHPIVDLYALEGIRLIAAHLETACKSGNNIEARSNVALGSVYGGLCLGPVNTAAAHALAYPIGVHFHIGHGLSVALVLPAVMEYNLDAAPGKYAAVALALGATKQENDACTAKTGIEKLKQLMIACGLIQSLSDLNIPKTAIPQLAADAIKVQRLLKNNPKEILVADAIAIYEAAY
jgi:alcohol dehydrogenase class IV